MKKIVAIAVAAGLFTGGATLVVSHSTGHEMRKVAQCEKLPSPERQNCVKCVTRPLKHHFHPDYPAGNRCRPDNGKP